jgi:hypothetical protein
MSVGIDPFVAVLNDMRGDRWIHILYTMPHININSEI